MLAIVVQIFKNCPRLIARPTSWCSHVLQSETNNILGFLEPVGAVDPDEGAEGEFWILTRRHSGASLMYV